MYMYGGSIRDNQIQVDDDSSGSTHSLIHFATAGPLGQYTARQNGFFVKEGGSITGNVNQKGEPWNIVQFNNDQITIEEGVQYSMPPLPPTEE
jgi:hypothetical protein